MTDRETPVNSETAGTTTGSTTITTSTIRNEAISAAISGEKAEPTEDDDKNSGEKKKRKRTVRHVDRDLEAKQKFDAESTNYAEEIDDGFWIVRSFRNTAQNYEVKLNQWDRWECSCKDFQYRGHSCKHIKLVLLELSQKNLPRFLDMLDF